MTVKSLLLIILGGVLVNNYVFQSFLGLAPAWGFSDKEGKRLPMGLAVTLVMLLSTALAWPLHTFVLVKLGVTYLDILCYTAIVLLSSCIVRLFFKKTKYAFTNSILPLLALNSAVLGLAVNNAAEGFNYLESLMSALGAGIGFTLAMLIFAGLQSRVDNVHVPKAFRGLPAGLLAASIISMALTAFV